MKAMSDTQTPQGVLAVVKRPSYDLEDILARRPAHLLLVEGIGSGKSGDHVSHRGRRRRYRCDHAQDDGRSFFIPRPCARPWEAFTGCLFMWQKTGKKDLHRISEAGISLYAAHLQGKQMYDMFDYRSDCGFLIGNEGNGLTDATAAMADAYLRIPMEGSVESLNAAMAAGILMYEVNRQRRQK